MTDQTITLESLLLMMCKTTAQSPMTDGQIATLNKITLNEVNAMLDKLYEGKAISSVKNTKGGIEQRLVWATGLPYRPALSISKEVAWQHLRTPIAQPQPIEPKQDITMHDKKTIDLIVPNNLLEAGIKTPQKIVRFLFANTKATSNEIRKNCQIEFVDPFIKAYVRKGYIERTKNQDNLAVYAITPKGRLLGSADALYNHARIKHPKKMVAKPINDKEAYISLDGANITVVTQDKHQAESDNFFIDDGRRYKALDIQQELKPASPDDLNQVKQPIELKYEPAQHIRFALTDEGTLMILGVHYTPIELSKDDTRRLYDFAENTVHAI